MASDNVEVFAETPTKCGECGGAVVGTGINTAVSPLKWFCACIACGWQALSRDKPKQINADAARDAIAKRKGGHMVEKAVVRAPGYNPHVLPPRRRAAGRSEPA